MTINFVLTGTVAVTNGLKTVVGTGTFWTANNVKNGDTMSILNQDGVYSDYWVDSLNEGTQTITLVQTYAGDDDASTVYAIKPTSPEWYNNITVSQHLTELLALLDEQADSFDDLTQTHTKASDQIVNLGISCAVGGSALTIALRQADGATSPTADNPVKLGFRSSTAASGLFVERSVTAALSLVIPSGATLGQTSAVAANLYLYAIDNAGTVELAVAGYDAGDTGIVSTTILDTASDSASVMYSTAARANVAFRKLARLPNTQTTAGTWAAVPSPVVLAPMGEPETAYFKTLKAAANAAGALTSLGVSAAAQSILDDATVAAIRDTLAAGGTIRIQTFTGSGTYTPHAKMVACIAAGVGAGGGSGGVTGSANQGYASGGGGSGAFALAILTAAQIGASQAVAIGAAGAAGAAGNNNGGAGGNTTLGSLLRANGGSPGLYGSATQLGQGGDGGTVTSAVGDVLIPGSDGGHGDYINNATVTNWMVKGGDGGGSLLGARRKGIVTNVGPVAAGTAGRNYGGGAGGAASVNSAGGTAAGAAGSAGFLIIIEFCSS